MKARLPPLVTLAALFAATAARVCTAADYHITCPPTFEAQAIKFGPVTPGWTPFAPSSLTVQEGFILYGPPQSLAYAKPGTVQEGTQSTKATWDLQGSPQLEKWLSCGYGEGHELTLSKQLPNDVAMCTIIATKDKLRGVVGVVAHCQSNGK